MMNDDIAFGANIQRLINKQDLSQEACYQMFCALLNNQQCDLHQGAFLAALVSKGESTEEMIGAWQAISELDTVSAQRLSEQPIIENSGTGMDSLKTFNVSSAAAIVAAACGATMARHGARALSSLCGTVDILESVGIDVECDIKLIEQSVLLEGIGLFNGMSPKVHPGGLGRILSQIRFGTTLNIAASLANPIKPSHGVRGVYAESLVAPVSELMAGIGYQRAMVVFGKVDDSVGGMDELSICGETVVQELDQAGLSASYVLRPEDVGLSTRPFTEIAATGKLDTERRRFLQVLGGSEHQGCIDFTCLNAGAVLYIGGQASGMAEGVNMAQEAIASGAAIDKLRRWVAVQNHDPVKGLAHFDAQLAASLL